MVFRDRALNLIHKVKTFLPLTGESPDRPSRLQIVLLGVLLVSMIIISLINFNSYQLGTHFDDSRYVILARSLLYNDHYAMVNFPAGPVPERYPFGYPLLLVPFLWLFSENLEVLKVLSLLATIVNVIILFFGWRLFVHYKSYWWGLAYTSLYALSPMVIDHTHRVMSEPVFMTFCLIAILLAERYVAGRSSRLWTTWMSLVLFFVVYTRTIGIVLVGSVFLYLLLVIGRKFWIQILLILTQMALLMGLIVWLTPVQLTDLLPLEYLKDENARALVALPEASLPDLPQGDPFQGEVVTPTSSADWTMKLNSLRDLFSFGVTQHFRSDVRVIALPIGGGDREQEIADHLGLSSLPILIGYLTSALVIGGVIRLWVRHGKSLFLLFAILYFAAIFFWYWNDPRLLYPIQVQIFMAFFAGLEGVIYLINRLIGRKSEILKPSSILTVIMTLFIIVSAYKSVLIQDSRLHTGDLRTRTKWLLTHSLPTDIIMTEAPETDYLYTDRKTLNYPHPMAASMEDLASYLNENQVTYILVAPEIKWMKSYSPEYSPRTNRIIPLLESLVAQNRVKLAYSSDQELIQVFQVLR